MAARHFLDQLGAGPVLSKDSDTDEARVLVVQVQERLQPAQGERILEWHDQQPFPSCPSPDDPDACNVYRELEAAPIGSKPSCKADTDPRSYGELLKLPDSKERLRARTRTLPHRAHLGAVPRPAAREGSRPPARLPPTPRPRSGGLREAHRGPRLRLRLLAHSRRDVFGYHYKAQA